MQSKETVSLSEKLKELIRSAQGGTVFNGTIYEMCRIWGYGPVTANRRLQEMRQPEHPSYCPNIQVVLNHKKYKIGYYWAQSIRQQEQPVVLSKTVQSFLEQFPSKVAIAVEAQKTPVNALF